MITRLADYWGIGMWLLPYSVCSTLKCGSKFVLYVIVFHLSFFVLQLFFPQNKFVSNSLVGDYEKF